MALQKSAGLEFQWKRKKTPVTTKYWICLCHYNFAKNIYSFSTYGTVVIFHSFHICSSLYPSKHVWTPYFLFMGTSGKHLSWVGKYLNIRGITTGFGNARRNLIGSFEYFGYVSKYYLIQYLLARCQTILIIFTLLNSDNFNYF